MTRLKEDWITSMAEEMAETEGTLKRRTGYTYRQLAARAAEMTDAVFCEKTKDIRAGVITITTGEGKIGSFAESIAGILRHMSIPTEIMERTDVDGLYEAHEKKLDVVFMADDDRFLGINLKNGKIGENNLGTAKGFVAALEGAIEVEERKLEQVLKEEPQMEENASAEKCTEAAGKSPLYKKDILIIGCGIVGRLMAKEVHQRGGNVVCWDMDPLRLEAMTKEGYEVLNAPHQISEYKYILDASSSGSWIEPGLLHPDSLYVSPGVPLSLTKEAEKEKKDQMVHDLLQIGVASMLALAL